MSTNNVLGCVSDAAAPADPRPPRTDLRATLWIEELTVRNAGIRIGVAGALGAIAGALRFITFFSAGGAAEPGTHGLFLLRGLVWPWGMLPLAMALSVLRALRSLPAHPHRTRLLARFVLASLALVFSALAFAGYDLVFSPDRMYAWAHSQSAPSALLDLVALLRLAPVAFGIAVAISFALTRSRRHRPSGLHRRRSEQSGFTKPWQSSGC